jgi:hypothetical protein
VNLVVLGPAELEASLAALWYEGQRPQLGDEFLSEVTHAYDRIAHDPGQFAKLSLVIPGRELRVCLLRRFPHLVVFECRTNELIVVAVAHGRREPLYWLDRLR